METNFQGPGIFLNITNIIHFVTTIFLIHLFYYYLLLSSMSKEEYDLVRTELLVTQQNFGNSGELESAKRDLRAARRIIRRTEEQLREANLKIDDLNWEIEGTYHPTPKHLNPVPFNIIVGDIEKNIVSIRRSLNNRIARCLQYHHYHHYHGLPQVNEIDPLYFCGELDYTDLFREYQSFLDIIDNIPLDPSDHF